MGTFQNMSFKTSRLTGWRTLYISSKIYFKDTLLLTVDTAAASCFMPQFANLAAQTKGREQGERK